MKNVVAFNLARVTDADAAYFLALRNAFVQAGANFVLFSPNTHDLIRDFHKPFDWTIKNIPAKLPIAQVVPQFRLTDEQYGKWSERVATLAVQDFDGPPEELVDILEKLANYILDTYQPDLILSWNTLCPHSGVLGEIASGMGITTYLMERGFLDQTWFVESGGLVGHSHLVGSRLEDLTGDRFDEYLAVGRSYLDASPFDKMLRYAQNQTSRFSQLLARSRVAGRPVIGFFPPDDLSLGFVPADHEDRRKHLPDYETSLDAARGLAESSPHVDVYFKPHPSFREKDLPEQLGANLFIVDHDYRDVIRQSDIVASTGSGLIVQAMAAGKPVIQMNRDQFANKGITFETLDNPRAAVDAAVARQDLPLRLERFEAFIGYCLREYLVSAPSADASFRKPANVVRDIAIEVFGITPDWPIQPARVAGAANVTNGRVDMFRSLQSGNASHYLVDFDHTLLFGNTTELFLKGVWPGFLFTWIHWLVSWWTPWSKLAKKGIRKDQLFDPLRVLVTCLVSPWNLILWRIRARKLTAEKTNRPLVDALKTAGQERVVVVSNGHRWLVAPLVKAMGLDKATIVCGNRLPTKTDIRRIGKLAACSRDIPGFLPGRSIAISDSLDDIELLTRVRWGYLIDWNDPKDKADPLARYFPFVLTSEGKYPRAGVVRRHRFQEDLPVILAAFALAGLSFPALLGMAQAFQWQDALSLLISLGLKAAALFTLFVSFNTIYEIGYWQNDFISSQNEETPNVSAQMEKFRTYPVRRGWIWGFGLGWIGTGLATLSGGSFTLFSVLPFLNGPWTQGLTGFVLVWAVLCILWSGGLVVSRYVFRKHNTITELARIYTFFALHVLKLFLFALVLTPALSGVILIFAQVFRHRINYVVYRFKGDRSQTPKREVRGFFFVVLTLMMLAATSVFDVIDLTWLAGAILLTTTSGGSLLPFSLPGLRRKQPAV